jgi:hypothetical protein
VATLPSYFDTYLFSVANMLTANFGNMIPYSTEARAFATLQLVSSASIGVILLLVFTTLNRARFDQEIDEGIRDMREVLKEIDERRRTDEPKSIPASIETANGSKPTG